MNASKPTLISLACLLASCLGVDRGTEAERDSQSDASDTAVGTDASDTAVGLDTADTTVGLDTADTTVGTDTADTTDTFVPPPTCAAGCDDGNPCTDDGCLGGQCLHDALSPCSVECSTQGLVPVSVILSPASVPPYQVYVGTPVKTRGIVQMGPHGTCTDDGLCNCNARPALVDGDEVALTSLAPEDETAMFCASRDTAPPESTTVACEPFAVGVPYRVWGTGTSEWGGGPGGWAQPVIPLTGIAVEGYCLETAGEALAGDYRLVFEEGATRVVIEVEVVPLDVDCDLDVLCTAVALHIPAKACDGCALDVGERWYTLERLDNGVRFTAELTGGVAIVARLASVASTLTGPWIDRDHAWGARWGRIPEDSVPVPAELSRSGTLTLERLPSNAPRNPCGITP